VVVGWVNMALPALGAPRATTTDHFDRCDGAPGVTDDYRA